MMLTKILLYDWSVNLTATRTIGSHITAINALIMGIIKNRNIGVYHNSACYVGKL